MTDGWAVRVPWPSPLHPEKNRAKRLAYQAARRAADPEGVRAYKRELYARNPEHRAYINERSREWREANPDRQAAYASAWAESNREKARAIKSAWEKRNPDAVRERTRRARARRRDAAVTAFTIDQLAARLSMFSGCWVCGGGWSEVDHVKPLAKGGLHCLSNLRPICLSCNRRKSDRWPFAA